MDPKLIKVIENGHLRYKRRCVECAQLIHHQSARCKSYAGRRRFRPVKQPRQADGRFMREEGDIVPRFEIWSEGFSATGEHETAKKLGEAEGETFRDACDAYVRANPWARQAGYVRDHKPSDMMPGYEQTAADSPPTIWGCGLYDNEADARKSFG
jgi:hypothetical protein